MDKTEDLTTLNRMNFERGPGERQRIKKRWRNLVAFLAPILLILGTLSWFLYPPRENPAPSDAVLVIAGAYDGRHELGAYLVEEGISQNFVVSNSSGAKDKIGSAHCRGDKRPAAAGQTWCMRSNPITTAGEAMAMGKLAEAEGWTTVTAVTNRPHTRRVRTMFEQCTNLDVVVVPIDHMNMTRMLSYVAHEIGGYLKFWLTNPCRDVPEIQMEN